MPSFMTIAVWIWHCIGITKFEFLEASIFGFTRLSWSWTVSIMSILSIMYARHVLEVCHVFSFSTYHLHFSNFPNFFAMRSIHSADVIYGRVSCKSFIKWVVWSNEVLTLTDLWFCGCFWSSVITTSSIDNRQMFPKDFLVLVGTNLIHHEQGADYIVMLGVYPCLWSTRLWNTTWILLLCQCHDSHLYFK